MKRDEFLKSLTGLALGSVLAPPLLAGKPAHAGTLADWPQMDAKDERFWGFVRDQFPLTRERAYMNTGGLGASPYVVIDAVKGKMDELEKISEVGRTQEVWDTIKGMASELLGADPEEIAFTHNTTEGINIVANGLPLREGDEVILSTQEHVANILPWLALRKRKGIRLRLFEPSTRSQQENLDRIQKLISGKTRLICATHAITTTGLLLPVKEIGEMAKAKGIWFFVDGAQTPGMLPFSLHDMGCDAFATSGHKWLMGPKETGLFYVRKDMLDVYEPPFMGAHSGGPFDFEQRTYTYHPTAQRYEWGTVNVPLRVGLGAAIGFIDRIGIQNIWKRDQMLSARLYSGLREIPGVTVLSPENPEMRSALITFMHESVPYQEIAKHLGSLNLRTRTVSEGGLQAVRVSTHIYNSVEEVERVLEGVRSAGKG
jgi:selenocysteine lyase/cysteine desulfurase